MSNSIYATTKHSAAVISTEARTGGISAANLVGTLCGISASAASPLGYPAQAPWSP